MNHPSLYLLPIFALITPFALLPVEMLLPFPFVVEEIAKASLLIPLLSVKRINQQIQLAILVGIFFTLSESVLYLFNIYATGTPMLFIQRLLLTGALHTGTILTMFFVTKIDRRLLPIGVIITMIIHFFYNQYISL